MFSIRRLSLRLASGAAALALLSLSAEAGELKLKRVMLSSGGVGYFEYQAEVSGWETIEVPVRLDQELEDARWFHAGEIERMPGLLPQRFAIARRLLEAWFDEAVGRPLPHEL